MKKEWSDFHQIVKSTMDNVAFNRVQKRGMKRYDEMTLMWAEGTATGGFAHSSNDRELSVEEERGMQRTLVYTCNGWRVRGNTPFNGKRCFDIHSPYPIGSTSSLSSKRKIEDLQCAVLITMLEEPTVTGGVTEKWTPEECLADVRLVDGVTPMDVVNASAKFPDSVQRNIYMEHTPDENLAWINKYCRNI